MSLIGKGPAPAPGQASNNCSYPSPSTALVTTTRTAIVINVPSTEPMHLDVRIRDRFVRYTSDPRADAGTPGLWRAGGDGARELISPFALTRIEVGGHGAEISVIHPRTGNVWIFEGSIDDAATGLWRAGRALGCRADRKLIFWGLTDICNEIRRQAAARGCSL